MGQHHEHQLVSSLDREGARASIMSISWPVLWIERGPGQHHEHMLSSSLDREGAWASIMSISWPDLWLERWPGPAS